MAPSNKKTTSADLQRSPVLHLRHPRLCLPSFEEFASDQAEVYHSNLPAFKKALSCPPAAIGVGLSQAQSLGLVQDLGKYSYVDWVRGIMGCDHSDWVRNIERNGHIDWIQDIKGYSDLDYVRDVEGCSHLDWVFTVLVWNQPSRQEKVDAVLVALRGIAVYDTLSSRPISSKLIDIWPDMLKWMLYACLMKGIESDMEECIHVRDTIAAALYVMARNDELAKLMTSDPDAHKVVYKLWLTFPDNPGLEASGGVPILPWLCFLFIDALPRNGAPQLELLIDAAGGDIKLIAETACAPLHREYDLATAEGLSRLHHHMIIFNIFRQTFYELDGATWRVNPSHPLVDALIDARCIELHVKVLLQVAEIYREGRTIATVDLVALWFDFTCFLSHAPASCRGIVLAVDAGILTAFAVMSHHLSCVTSNMQNAVTQLLLKILPMFLIFRPVIHACHEFLETLSPDDEALVMKSAMAEPWKEFRSIVAERHAIAFTPGPNSARTTQCTSSKCFQIGPKTDFMRCGRCLVTVYCSKKCQIQDWKEGGHKVQCQREARKDLEPGGYQQSEKEHKFVEQLVEYEAKKHKAYLRAETEKKLREGLTLENLCVSADYTVFPRKLAVEPIEHLLNKDWGLGARHEKYVFSHALSIASKGGITVVEIVFSSGPVVPRTRR